MRALPTLATVAVLFAGCGTDEPSLSETEGGVTATNRIALNRIALNRIALNRIALNRIALNRIALNRIALNTIALGDLLNDPADRDVLDYLIECAFPEGVTLQGTADDGVTYTFDGLIGLAPRWETRRLTLKEQRWISACMLARVNKDGHEILISLRGPHNALTVTTEETNRYDLEEGAYYGDIFAAVPRFFACRGDDLYSGEFGDTFALRACAQPTEAGDTTLCGMTYAGECGAFNVERTCERQAGDNYERCHTSPSKNGKFHDESIETRFEEVITVYVKP
jgi:hypothetical protein